MCRPVFEEEKCFKTYKWYHFYYWIGIVYLSLLPALIKTSVFLQILKPRRYNIDHWMMTTHLLVFFALTLSVQTWQRLKERKKDANHLKYHRLHRPHHSWKIVTSNVPLAVRLVMDNMLILIKTCVCLLFALFLRVLTQEKRDHNSKLFVSKYCPGVKNGGNDVHLKVWYFQNTSWVWVLSMEVLKYTHSL